MCSADGNIRLNDGVKKKLFWIVRRRRRRKTLTWSYYMCAGLADCCCCVAISVTIHFLSWFLHLCTNEQWSFSLNRTPRTPILTLSSMPPCFFFLSILRVHIDSLPDVDIVFNYSPIFVCMSCVSHFSFKRTIIGRHIISKDWTELITRIYVLH